MKIQVDQRTCNRFAVWRSKAVGISDSTTVTSKKRMFDSDLLPGQLEPLKQRLDTLESFMPSWQATQPNSANKKKNKSQSAGSSWTPKVRPSSQFNKRKVVIGDWLAWPVITIDNHRLLLSLHISWYGLLPLQHLLRNLYGAEHKSWQGSGHRWGPKGSGTM